MDGRSYVLQLLNRRLRTRAELNEALQRKNINEAERQEILNEYEEYGLINDRRFARSWIYTRDALKPRGASLLRLELLKKGIAKDIIEEALLERKQAALEEEGPDEVALAMRLVEGKQRLYAGLDKETFRRRVTGLLARRGFSYSVIQRILETCSMSDK